MAAAVLIGCAVLVAWTYVGYPILLAALSRVRRRPGVSSSEDVPRTTLLITARNEEGAIRGKLENALSLDYPADRLQILVASDASEDATDDIVREFADREVQLVRSNKRRGKVAAQREAAARATGDVIVFSDATGEYERESLKELVKHFADESVACVGGVVRYRNSQDSDVARGEGLYWRYEMWLRAAESNAGSVTILSGPMYAIRRSLYEAGPDFAEDDAFQPFRALQMGYRVVHEPGAVVEETSADTIEAEFTSKVRIVQRNLHALGANLGLLNPFRRPLVTLKVLSHRLLRWLVPLLLISMFVANLFLLHVPTFQALMALQVAFYVLGALGYLAERRGRRVPVLWLIFCFCLVNAGALVGVLRTIFGRKKVTWEPVR